MKLADGNPRRRVLFLVAIVMSVLQAATLVDADVVKCDDSGRWCCQQDVLDCKGLARDRLNYSIECLSPNVINVSWEITQREVTDDDYIVTAQYTCINSTSREESTWILSDHTTKLSDNIVLEDLRMGDDVSCTFTACTFGAKVGSIGCFDYIHQDDEVTIDSTCFETGDSHVLSSEASSVVPASTNLLQWSESSSLVTGLEVEIIPISTEAAFSIPMPSQSGGKNSNLGDGVVVLLCVGFIFIGLVSLSTFVAACYSHRKKAKVSDTLFESSVIYKPKPPTENVFADELGYVGVSGSLLTLLEPLQFFNIDHRGKALMIHMESSGEGFTHVGEDNDDPDGKCAHDNVSQTTVRLDDVQSLKDLCTCSHPNPECLSDCSSVNTPVHNHHQINGQTTRTHPAHVSSKAARSTRHLSSATSGYISTGYVSDSDASRLPSFRSGFTLSVSTDGYVGDTHLEPGLQENPDTSFREDSLEPPFISRHDDYVFDSSIDMTGGLPTHHLPGIPPVTGCCDVKDSSKRMHSLSSGASEYIRDSHSHQLHCSSSINTSADDRDCCSVSPMASDGYVRGFLSDAHLGNDRVREFDPAHCQPTSASLMSSLAQAKNGTDSSCNSNCIGSAAASELVAAQGQHSASLSATAVDGYIQDSSCIPPSPTGAVLRHRQPSTVPSSPASDGYIGDSSLSHQLHLSPPTGTSPGDQNCAPASLPVSDGYICEFPCDSPFPDDRLREFVPAHKQPSAPSATVLCASNCNNSSCSPHHLVPAHIQSPASPSVPTGDGYIHDSSCTPPPPAGTPHGHGQPTIPSSALPSQPSTPTVDGYIDSSCVPQPPADEAHRLSKSSALPSHLASDGYISDSSHGLPTSVNAACGIDSVQTQLSRHQPPYESDGYVYNPSHTSPVSVNTASGLYTGHRQPCASPPTSVNDGYIHDQSRVRPSKLLPSRESKGYIMASDSRQPVATPPTTSGDGYICDSYNAPSCSSAPDFKDKGEVGSSAHHPCLHFLSDVNPTTSLVDTNRLQPQAARFQPPPPAIDGVTRNMRLQISIDIPTQALPLSGDYVTESSLPPRAGCSSTRKYTPPSLLTKAHDYLDQDSLCSTHGVCRNEPKYTREEIPKVCMNPNVDPAHGDGYIITPLHS